MIVRPWACSGSPRRYIRGVFRESERCHPKAALNHKHFPLIERLIDDNASDVQADNNFGTAVRDSRGSSEAFTGPILDCRMAVPKWAASGQSGQLWLAACALPP